MSLARAGGHRVLCATELAQWPVCRFCEDGPPPLLVPPAIFPAHCWEFAFEFAKHLPIEL